MEVATGILATLAGLAGLGFALFGPFYTYSRTTARSVPGDPSTVERVTETGTESLLGFGLHPLTAVFLCGVVLLLLGVLVGAWTHGRRDDDRWGQRLLWGCTVVLWLAVVVSGFSIGPLLLPAAVLATITSLLAIVPRSPRRT